MITKIAITGGLACGKSSVCNFLKDLGATVINADEIVHRLISSNSHLGKKIIALLGDEVIVNGKLNRRAIADKVFKDLSLLQKFEECIHPVVWKEIDEQIQNTKNSLIVVEVPLLFETEGEQLFDLSIVVVADPEVCQKRFVAATGFEAEEYERRMARQEMITKKIAKADYVIYNNDDLKALKEETKKLWVKIKTYHRH